MGPVRGGLLIGIGALGAFGIISALLDGNDAKVPEADSAAVDDAVARTLAQIDWNRDVIVVQVPGTEWGITQELVDGVDAAAGAGNANVAWLRYPASASHMPESVAVGKAALAGVLDEIQRRDPSGTRYHVALMGESQGSWVINDLLAEHPYRETVDRVQLYGLPGAATHDDAMRRDARARVTNHPLDPITWPFLGPSGIAAAAPGFLIGGEKADAPAAALQSVLNPLHALAFGAGELAHLATKRIDANPHVYLEHHGTTAPEWLLDGWEA